jgi:DNA polymerase
MRKAHADFETRSALDLRECGVHAQMEHVSSSPWMMSWWIEEDVKIIARGRWHPGDPDPVALLEHVANGGIFAAHNAIFERTVWNICIRQRICPHWPVLRIEQMDCTMSRCAVLAIPQTLEIAAQVLGAKAKKDMEGNALMRKMMVPRAIITEPDGRTTYQWHDDAKDVARLGAYCDQDVVTEAEIDNLAPPLSPMEREIWMLDQRINDRGVKLDIPTIEKMRIIRDMAKKRMDARMAAITNGAVTKCSQNARLVDWIAAHGIPCKSIAKDQKEDIITWAAAWHIPQIQEAIELRTEAAKTSTAKLDAMLASSCADGRSRGALHFHGTNTGRWAGRIWQPHNLYRTDAKRDGAEVGRTLDFAMHHPSTDALALMEMIDGRPMVSMAKTMRSMIIAERGHLLRGADLSNIEGRIGAWLPDETWKLDAFAAYDAGRGPDLYKVAYSKSFGVEVDDVDEWGRQLGKVEELSCQYQGSVGSFMSMGRNYGMKPAGLVAPVQAVVDADTWISTAARYGPAQDKRGLPADQWTAIKIVVNSWRAAHPKLVQGWWDLQDAAVEAVGSPGLMSTVFNGRVSYLAARGFLWCRLPSGRVLAYSNPRLKVRVERWAEMPDGSRVDLEENEDATRYILAGAKIKERARNVVLYDGYDGEHKRWTTFSLYGGMQFNHIVQGTARDVLAGGMLRLEARGYCIILTVHDETLTENAIGFGSVREVEQLMTQGEPWLAGCPLAAKGWEGPRYGK